MLALTIRSLLLAVLYWGGVKIGLLFFEEQISILWPANGIALAFFMATSRREWGPLCIAMAAGYYLGLVELSAQPTSVKVGFLLANYIEIVPAAYFIRHVLSKDIRLDSLNGILCFLGFCVVIGPLLGSFFATIVAVLGFEQDFSIKIWIGWGVGNGVSTLAVALPTYFLLTKDLREIKVKRNRDNIVYVIELMALTGITVCALYLSFIPNDNHFLLNGAIHILFPLAIWAALRFSTQIISGWLFAVVFCAASSALVVDGPFAIGAKDIHAAVFYLHTFSYSLCMTGLLLGGVMADRRRIESSLRIANDAKSDFLSSMSHELRTPLNAIIGFSDLIKHQTSPSDKGGRIHEYAGDINQAGLHLLSLINDVLDLSKVEVGKERLIETNLDVPTVVNSVISMVQHRARKGHVGLDVWFEQGLALLHADERKIKQILINLLGNAIKFTDPGGKVSLRAWSSSESGHVVQIIDTGIGIATEDIPKALSQFGQVERAINRKYEGTGLGLPLTKALVELHGGSLDLQSEVSVGTTVTVRLPAARIALHSTVTDGPDVDYGEAGEITGMA